MVSGDDKSRRRKLSEEERTLWGRVTRSIAPLRRRPLLIEPGEPAALPVKRNPFSSTRPQGATRHLAPAAKPLPQTTPHLEPLERRHRQRLARGILPLDARIDLHGRTQSEAHSALLSFVRRAQADGARFVLVITGKGGPTRDDWGERGVLKRQVPHWLGLPEFRNYVIGFEHAHIGHGGEGALYVRLRRARTT
jgi:DNA-nicking Smr family endonuclease